MEEKIIELLRKHDEYLSGEDLSKELKVSRQALWKHVQNLKELGFDIAAVPHLGYRLVSSPDRLYDFEIQHGLKTKSLGRKVLYFDSLDSTMDMATKLAMQGCPEGTLVLAEAQSKGRGRMGRAWHSPKYKGLYFSLVLRPKISVDKAAVITLLCGVSIAEAVKEISGSDVQIKWPNDILIRNKKLGGILTEIKAEMDEAAFMIIGVGLNINNDKKSLITGATSLREEAGSSFKRVEVLRAILQRLEAHYLSFRHKGPAEIIEKWRRLALTIGRRVKVSSHSEHIEGEAFDVDLDGALLIRNDSGLTRKVIAGDVLHCR
jgi:BirA family biotin operon repressor/biotin-[acetyl-CoA-carboxylase] ligase